MMANTHTVSTQERLARGARMLNLLEYRRRASGDQNLGSNIERLIVERELADLEREICLDPGALASLFVPAPVRPRRVKPAE